MDEKDFDLDALEAEFESSFVEEEETEVEETEVEEAEVEETEEVESEEETEETQDDESSETTEETEETEANDTKENPEVTQYRETITTLQKQIDEAKKVESIFDEIAKSNGVSRDELLTQYERKKLEDEAKAQNIPVEYLEKQRNMEKQLAELQESKKRDSFNSNVGAAVAKYSLSDDDVRATLDYAYSNGLDPFAVNFESLYKAANFDKLLEKQVKETRQKELADKQKRMSKAAVSHGGSATPGPSIDDEVTEFLKEQGII
jgi:hypothetical protein